MAKHRVRMVNKGGSPVKVIDVNVYLKDNEFRKGVVADFVCPCTSTPVAAQGMMYFEQYDGSGVFINIDEIEQIDISMPRDPKPEEYSECP